MWYVIFATHPKHGDNTSSVGGKGETAEAAMVDAMKLHNKEYRNDEDPHWEPRPETVEGFRDFAMHYAFDGDMIISVVEIPEAK